MNKYYQKNRYVSFLDVFEDDESLWVANVCWNGLFKLEKREKRVEYIASFEMEKTGKSGSGLYSHVVHYGKWIFFLPANSYNIAVYDQEKGVIRYIYLPYMGDACGYGTVGHALYGEWIYLFSGYAGCTMVRVNVNTWKVEELQVWKEIVTKYSNMKENGIIYAVVQIGHEVWLGIYHTNKLLKYSLVDGSYEIIELNYDIYKVFGSENLQELYIVPKDKSQVVIYNLKEQKEKQCIELYNFMGKDNKILNILVDEELFVLIPYYGKFILLVDRKNSKIRKYDSFPQEFNSFRVDNRFFYQGRVREECIELFPYMANGIIRIDRKSEEAELQITEIPWQGSVGDLVWHYHYHNSVIQAEYNESIYPLKHFLGRLVNEDSRNKKENLEGKIGRNIIQYIFHESG